MLTKPKFLVFSGSTRKDSYNKKLAKLAEKILVDNQSEVTYLDLRDFPMPLYDGDLEEEQGIPENGMKFRAILKNHQALLICAPEYNSSISGVLKNAIDWASRPIKGEPPLVCFKGKIVNLMSTSLSKWGGLRGLVTVRSILSNIGCIVLPDQLCIPFADKAFNSSGILEDKDQYLLLETICKDYIKITTKISFPDHCIEAT
jgi:chromate reductase